MDDDLDRIFKNSSKAELIEMLQRDLEDHDKAIVILIQDKDGGKYSSVVATLGLATTYEAYGVLEVARQDIAKDDQLS